MCLNSFICCYKLEKRCIIKPFIFQIYLGRKTYLRKPLISYIFVKPRMLPQNPLLVCGETRSLSWNARISVFIIFMNNKGGMMILPPCVSCHHNAKFFSRVGTTIHPMICVLQWKERGFKDKHSSSTSSWKIYYLLINMSFLSFVLPYPWAFFFFALC